MRKNRFLSMLMASVLLLTNVSSNMQIAFAEDMSEVELFGEGEEGYGGYEDYNSGQSYQDVSTQPSNPNNGGENSVQVSQKVEDINNANGTGGDSANAGNQNASANTETLSSTSFDISKGSVSIWDDPNNAGMALVEVNGVQYPNVNSNYFEFTGSSSENKISVMTDREYTVLLKDLNLSTDVPVTLYGNGKINLYVEGSVNLSSKNTALFTSGNVSVDINFYEKAYLRTNGVIGATEDGAQITVNNGYISGSKLFTGKPVVIRGGSFDVPVSNASIKKTADDGSSVDVSLHPVTMKGLGKETYYTAEISGYSYGAFGTNKNGEATIYLPEGTYEVKIGVAEKEFTVEVSKDSVSVVEKTEDGEEEVSQEKELLSEVQITEEPEATQEDNGVNDFADFGDGSSDFPEETVAPDENSEEAFFDEVTEETNATEAIEEATEAISEETTEALESLTEAEIVETEEVFETEEETESISGGLTETESVTEAV